MGFPVASSSLGILTGRLLPVWCDLGFQNNLLRCFGLQEADPFPI